MKFIRLSLACLVVSLLSSVGWAKKYDGLKVPDFKNISIAIEQIRNNKAGVTKELVERAVKLRLLANGIKPNSEIGGVGFFLINVNIVESGTAYRIDLKYVRFAFTLPVEAQAKTGRAFTPEQGAYGGLGVCGQNGSYVIDHINQLLDDFILDYLESNIE